MSDSQTPPSVLAQLEVIRSDVARLVAKVDEIRDLKPQVSANAAAITRLDRLMHGSDGDSGLVVNYATLSQQMKAMLWTVRAFGGASVVTLVAIFWRLLVDNGAAH